jgi:glyceraldehyde-3-phosphate dehydrogenase/erythrose-4-phosphate dehydrogenase
METTFFVIVDALDDFFNENNLVMKAKCRCRELIRLCQKLQKTVQIWAGKSRTVHAFEQFDCLIDKRKLRKVVYQ